MVDVFALLRRCDQCARYMPITHIREQYPSHTHKPTRSYRSLHRIFASILLHIPIHTHMPIPIPSACSRVFYCLCVHPHQPVPLHDCVSVVYIITCVVLSHCARRCASSHLWAATTNANNTRTTRTTHRRTSVSSIVKCSGLPIKIVFQNCLRERR